MAEAASGRAGASARGDVAHIGHVELLSPTPAESLSFFTDVMGMEEEGRTSGSVFLRGLWDYERYCLKLTESPSAGLGHVALRVSGPEALERRVNAVEASGHGLGWIDGDLGHGPAYRLTDPDGRLFEIYYETERYRPPEQLRPPMLNQFQRHTGRGVGVRRLEHVNFLSQNVQACREFLESVLGYRTVEVIELDDGSEYGAWLTASVQGHEIIYIREQLPANGRLHHVAFWVDTREEVLRAADIFQDSGVFIEAGPAKHTPIHSFYLYVYEPGGNRVEVCSGGYLVFDPDPEATVRWPAARYRSSRAWGREFPPSFDTYGTPQIDLEPPVSTIRPRDERGDP
jgi:catechol 2,3-dioxygenase